METAFDIISLVLFIVVILLAFFRKVNDPVPDLLAEPG